MVKQPSEPAPNSPPLPPRFRNNSAPAIPGCKFPDF